MNVHDASTGLCLECGLCCNGVLFTDVELQPADDVRRLATQGVRAAAVRTARGPQRIPQPCAALCADNCCRIYAGRPARCREFECGLLKEVISGGLELAVAARVVRQARQRAERVLALVRRLGDTDEHLPLGTRFRRARRRFETGGAPADQVELFGELTLAVHQLNLLTHERFYTRDTGGPAGKSD